MRSLIGKSNTPSCKTSSTAFFSKSKPHHPSGLSKNSQNATFDDDGDDSDKPVIVTVRSSKLSNPVSFLLNGFDHICGQVYHS